MEKIDLNSTWLNLLKNEFSKKYFKNLTKIINKEYINKKICPPKNKIFNALKLLEFKNIKVVIIGQDPYHGENQANGLSFSVSEGTKIPPSLTNIYKEISNDFNISFKKEGDLSNWSKQGVLLLNSILTVQEGKPNSHKNLGWEIFTNSIIKNINSKLVNVVFLLWGKNAQKIEPIINKKKHLILKASHPSPLSAYRNFLGCKHFSKTNKYLKINGRREIKWVKK